MEELLRRDGCFLQVSHLTVLNTLLSPQQSATTGSFHEPFAGEFQAVGDSSCRKVMSMQGVKT